MRSVFPVAHLTAFCARGCGCLRFRPMGTGPLWHRVCWRSTTNHGCMSTICSDALPKGRRRSGPNGAAVTAPPQTGEAYG
jgi:hypothetical protein